jgi:3-oxoadipate enol-lactonase
MPFATHLDGQIEYFVEGSGPPLVLLHGVANTAAMWTTIGYMDTLRQHFTTIAINSRGYGNSTPVTKREHLPYTLYRDDFLAVLDDAGVDQATVMGYSRGGVLAMAVAMEHPERVSALVVGGANLSPERSAMPWVRQAQRPPIYNPRRIAGGIRFRLRRLLGRQQPAPVGIGSVSRWAPVLRELGIPHSEAWKLFIGPVADIDRAVQRLTMPALFFQGELDALFPVEQTRMLVDRLPDAELAVIPGVGHDLIGKSELVLPVIEPFLLRIATRA